MLARIACAFLLSGCSWVSGIAQVFDATDSVHAPLAMNAIAADPFDIETGIYLRTYHDLFIQDSVPIDFVRTQRSMDPRSRSFGIGASTSYDMFIVGDTARFSWVALVLADGSREVYARVSPGTGFADAVFENKTTPDQFYGSRIYWNHGSWTVKLRDGSEYAIQGCSGASKPGQCAMTEHRNTRGERLLIRRDREGNIQRITSPHGRYVAVATDSSGRISRIQDDTGNRWVTYKYDAAGWLKETWSSIGAKQEFSYDARFNMTSVHETGVPRDCAEAYDFTVLNYYDSQDRLKFQTVSTGQQWSVDYGTPASDHSHINTVTAPDARTRYFFNSSGYEYREENFHGNRLLWTLELPRDAKNNSLLDMTLICATVNIRLALPATTNIQNGESRREFLSGLCDRPENRHPSSEKSALQH